MSDIKSEFYKTLNNIVGNDRLSNEEIYIINDYLGRLEATIKELQQENKQLKEDFAVLKKIQMISNDILNELEEWLKEQGNNGIDEWGNHYTICLYKLNKLKEKYK